MDQERQIRFLYPPFILIFSLLLGLLFDSNMSINDIIPLSTQTEQNYDLIILIIGGTISILVFGFILEMITMNFLWVIFYLFTKRHYAAADALNKDVYDKLSYLLLPDKIVINSKQRFYAAVTFDSAVIPKRIHDWIVRRWNSFNISCNSISALMFSVILICILNIKMSIWWIIIISVIGLFLIINALRAWYETKEMLEFNAYCDQEKIKKLIDGD